MSIQAVAWVLDHSESRGFARLVLISLANHWNAETGRCNPGQRRIADEAGISPSSVRAQIERLVALGEVGIIVPGTSHRTATYDLPFAREPREAEGTTRDLPVSTRDLPVSTRDLPVSTRGSGPRGSIEPRPTEPLLEPGGAASPNGAAPDALFPTPKTERDDTVRRIVAGYVDDYREERKGRSPSGAWCKAAGAAVKRALADGETEEDIQLCLGTIAHETKHPNTLAYVLGDFHADRPRRRIP